MATNNAAEMIPRIALKGTLGVSGPLNSDYDALINKPQINGNELAGNKTNAELGIPTELADLTADADHRTVSDTEKETWNAKSDFSGSYNDLTDVPEDLVEDAEYVHTDNNYTDAEKTKLGDIESGAEVNVQADWNEADSSADDFIKNKPTLGTAAAKNYTSQVASGSTDLVESGAVKSAIDSAVASSYHHAGVKTCAELVSSLLIAANEGNVYNITDDGVTTADFIEGAGIPIKVGDNVGIAKVGSAFKFDLLSGFIDTSNFVEKSATSGLIKNDGSIDTNRYALYSEIPDISDKAEKSEMAITTNGDKTTIQLKSGLSAQVLNAHQDISGKADKVSGATNGNLAGLDANGNLTDSGIATTDVEEMQDELSTDYATVEGNPINFSTKSAQNAKSTILSVEPIQDLHGYDKPWVGGAGKNLLPLTLTNLKTLNTNGTWVDNVYTHLGIDYTVISDNAGNVVKIKTSGTSSGTSVLLLGEFSSFLSNNSSYTINSNTYSDSTKAYLQIRKANNGGYVNMTEPYTFTYTTGGNAQKLVIRVDNQGIGSNIEFTIMIRDSSISDDTIVPYTNICPISGRTEIGILGCGKNLLENKGVSQTYSNIKYTVNSDGSVSTDNTANTNSVLLISNELHLIAGTRYILSGCPVNGGDSTYYLRLGLKANASDVWGTKIVNDIGSGVEFVAPESEFGFTINIGVNSGVNMNNKTYYPMVRLASDADSIFEPYTESNDLTISLGQTVYGGTLDVENGVLVVDRAGENLGSMTWTYDSQYGRFASSSLTSVIKIVSTARSQRLLFSCYECITDRRPISNVVSGQAYSGNNGVIYIHDSRYTEETDLQTALSGQTLVYPLATPITIQLTPHTIKLLEGVNNISTDGDKITLTYRDGSVATLGDLTSAVDNLDSKIDESKILTDTATGDKYILVVTNGVLSVQQISN